MKKKIYYYRYCHYDSSSNGSVKKKRKKHYFYSSSDSYCRSSDEEKRSYKRKAVKAAYKKSKKKKEPAEEVYRDAMYQRTYPHLRLSLFNEGVRRYERERFHEAMNLFRDAFRAIGYLDGNVPSFLEGEIPMTSCMYQRMDFDEGRHCFPCTLVLTETDGCSSALTLFYIGQAYRRMGDFDKALEYYDKARNHVLKQDIPLTE